MYDFVTCLKEVKCKIEYFTYPELRYPCKNYSQMRSGYSFPQTNPEVPRIRPGPIIQYA